jgi:glutathione S-transferase
MIAIYNFARGARGLRVIWQCEEMGLPYRLEMVSFPTNAAYRARNPLGTVPFLEDDGGVTINESVAMMIYLAQRYGPTPLLPDKSDPAFARVLQLTVFGEATIAAGLNPLLAAHFVAPEADKRNWSVRGQEARIAQAVRYVGNLLGTGSFLAGDQLTLADISVGTALGIWHGALDGALPDRLLAYQERMATRPAYQRAQAANRAPSHTPAA